MKALYHTGEPPDFLTGGGVDVDLETGVVTGGTRKNEWAIGIAWVDVRRWYRHHGYKIRFVKTLAPVTG